MPFAYWVSAKLREAFITGGPLKSIGDTRQGMATSDNNRFLREWFEVANRKIIFNAPDRETAKQSNKKWVPYNKGGAFRRWYGNCEYVLNWENDGEEVLGYAASLYGSPTRTIKSISEYFKPSISWSKVTAGGFSMRYFNEGFIFDVAGCSVFTEDKKSLFVLLGLTNSLVSKVMLESISPTLNYEAGHIASLPVFDQLFTDNFHLLPKELINKSKSDWDSYEYSWDFKKHPLLDHSGHKFVLKDTYQCLRANWRDITLEMQQLEEENNRIFIDFYRLQDELSSKVPLSEITLTCNPHYRYGGNKSESELESQLQEDTVKEFISYAVGCMFGRYSLERPGLILANPDETIEDYVQIVEKDVNEISFLPDDDAIIPVLNGEWFEDDAVARVREFLRVTFGNETLETNLRWLEESIGKNLRAYFCANTGGFYDHHLKTYKKRPIYWMFQSPKKHFRALVYLHRYTKDTVNQVLDGYLREFMHKLRSRMEHLDHVLASDSTPTREATQARREKDQIIAALRDCEEYEREILLPLAQKRVELDLDDGVKVNYNKLGNALAKVTGLSE